MIINWDQYPNFVEEEFRCKVTGLCLMSPFYLDRLQDLRTRYGRPIVVLSGYRHISHPLELKKSRPGPHTFGRAVDILVSYKDSVDLLRLALEPELGFTGFGIAQKRGSTRFIHLDDMEPDMHRPRPTIWSY